MIALMGLLGLLGLLFGCRRVREAKVVHAEHDTWIFSSFDAHIFTPDQMPR
jgi:hypothetical protein